MTLLLHLGLTNAEYFPKSWLEGLSFLAYVLSVWLNFDFQMVSSSSVAVPSSYWTGLMSGFYVWAQSLSCVWLFATPWTIARQAHAPLSMGFPRQEYWSGLPFLSPRDLSDPGIEPMSPVSPALAGGFFTTVPLGKPPKFFCSTVNKLSWALPSCPEIQSQPVPLGMPLNICKRSNKETWLLLTRIPQRWL